MVLFTARGRQDIATALTTKMDQSIVNETFSYLRVSLTFYTPWLKLIRH